MKSKEILKFYKIVVSIFLLTTNLMVNPVVSYPQSPFSLSEFAQLSPDSIFESLPAFSIDDIKSGNINLIDELQSPIDLDMRIGIDDRQESWDRWFSIPKQTRRKIADNIYNYIIETHSSLTTNAYILATELLDTEQLPKYEELPVIVEEKLWKNFLSKNSRARGQIYLDKFYNSKKLVNSTKNRTVLQQFLKYYIELLYQHNRSSHHPVRIHLPNGYELRADRIHVDTNAQYDINDPRGYNVKFVFKT